VKIACTPPVAQDSLGEVTMTEREPVSVSLGVDRAQLEGLIRTVQATPEAGKTVWKATTAWQQGFQSQAHIRSFTVPMDEPALLGGTDTAPNMVEMVLGAYGCCLTTGYVLQAVRRGIRLEAVDIEVEGDLDLNGFFGLARDTWPGYTEVRAKVHLTAPEATAEELQALHAVVTETSPVGSILERPVRIAAELTSE
jgi:uncharacterized OsmC-like protein